MGIVVLELCKVDKDLIESSLPDRIVLNAQVVAIVLDQTEYFRQFRVLKGQREFDEILVFFGHIRRGKVFFHEIVQFVQVVLIVEPQFELESIAIL